MRKISLIAAGVLVVVGLAAPAAAHPYESRHDYQHDRLAEQHGDEHDYLDEVHQEAHDDGLSPWEHRQLHRELRREHAREHRELRREHRELRREHRWEHRRDYEGRDGWNGRYGY